MMNIPNIFSRIPKEVKIATAGVVCVLFLITILIILSRQEKKVLPTPIQTTVEKIDESFLGRILQPQVTTKPETSYDTSSQQFPTSSPNPTDIQKTNDELNVLKWLDTQKDGKGRYYYGFSCTPGKDCTSPVESNRDGLAVIWGRFKYFEKTHDQNQNTIITTDLNTYTNGDKVNMIQNNFWNCKLMADIWNSSEASKEQKEKSQQICLRGMDEMDTGIIKELYENGTITSVPPSDMIIQGYGLPISLVPKDADFSKYGTLSSNFASRYKWTNLNEDLVIAKMLLTLGMSLYNQNNEKYSEYAPYLGIAALDLYRIEKGGPYIKFAETLLKAQDPNKCTTLINCIGYYMLAKNTDEVLKVNTYLPIQNGIKDYLMTYGYDESGKSGYVQGFKAFHSINPGDKSYYIRENGLIIGMLSE